MIGTIEQAMVDKLKTVSDSGTLGYKPKKISSYHGELDDELRHIIKDFPAWWVVFGGSQVIKRYSNSVKRKATFKLMGGAQSLRNEKSSRRGAAGKVGSYQMFEDAIDILSGETFGLEISALEDGSVKPLLNNKSDKDLASIYGVDFTTTYVTEMISPGADDLDDFQTFHSNWDLPPHGNVGPDLPDDENADVTDNLTLEN